MLDIAPQVEQAIITQAQNKGMSVNDLLADIFAPKQTKTIADMVKGKRLESFTDDPVNYQREIRTDTTPAINPMIALAKSLPEPTSYTKNAVELQREWRNEWD